VGRRAAVAGPAAGAAAATVVGAWARPARGAGEPAPPSVGPPPVRGATALVTGANSGIGFGVAKGLALLGFEVVPGCRTREKAAETARRLKSEVSGARVRVPDSALELSSLSSVRAFAEEMQSMDTLEIIVNNAGVAWTPELRTADGIELQFGVNHLGPFLLTTLLLDTLRENARGGGPARVVNVSSDAHLAGSISPAALVGEGPPKPYNRFGAYCDSKLCNVLFARELARREALRGGGTTSPSDLVAFAVHPGIVDTSLIRFIVPPWVLESRKDTPELSARVARGLGLRSADEGAAGALWLSASDQAPDLSGQYFVGPGEPRRPSAKAQNSDLARGLWAASEVLVARALGEAPSAGALDTAREVRGGVGGAELGEDLVPGLVRMLATNFAA